MRGIGGKVVVRWEVRAGSIRAVNVTSGHPMYHVWETRRALRDGDGERTLVALLMGSDSWS